MIRKIISAIVFFKYKSVVFLVNHFRYFLFIKQVQNPTQPITFELWYNQKINRINYQVQWPCHHTSRVVGVENISIGEGSFPGYMPGSYVQGLGKIVIGKFCIFGPNIGIISANHNIFDNSKHDFGNIEIGDYCWMGMNSIILPNVKLGDFTTVAAGAVVTKSFADGYCIIGGNPAKIIKLIDQNECIRYEMNTNFIGYISKIKK
jgi:acetyltransferase-like isoleucine patch superfamily enzyme